MKKTITVLLIIALIGAGSLCLAACDSSVDRGIVITRGERSSVDRYSSDDGFITMPPLHEGYFIQIVECDQNGNVIYDESGNIKTAWFSTQIQWEYDIYTTGTVFEYHTSGNWQKEII